MRQFQFLLISINIDMYIHLFTLKKKQMLNQICYAETSVTVTICYNKKCEVNETLYVVALQIYSKQNMEFLNLNHLGFFKVATNILKICLPKFTIKNSNPALCCTNNYHN